MSREVLTLVVATLMASAAHGQIHSCNCGDGTASVDYEIIGDTIRILQGNNNDYQFFARDPNNPSSPGDIANIIIASGATGNFTITIDSKQVTSPGMPGARNLGAANLRYADPNDGIVTVLGITLSQRIAADGDVLLDAVAGDIVAFGVTATERVSANAMTGNVELTDLDGDLEFGVMTGDITLTGTPSGTDVGGIIIDSNYAGVPCFRRSRKHANVASSACGPMMMEE